MNTLDTSLTHAVDQMSDGIFEVDQRGIVTLIILPYLFPGENAGNALMPEKVHHLHGTMGSGTVILQNCSTTNLLQDWKNQQPDIIQVADFSQVAIHHVECGPATGKNAILHHSDATTELVTSDYNVSKVLTRTSGKNQSLS